MSTIHPYYRYIKPDTTSYDPLKIDSDSSHVDLKSIHLPSYGPLNIVAEAIRLFDARAAATVSTATGLAFDAPGSGLLQQDNFNGDAPTFNIPTTKCLALLAYHDFFPNGNLTGESSLVEQAILASSPGWCGTNGDYDLSQMHLLPIAYRYYDKLSPVAREYLIQNLLAQGKIHRQGEDNIVTSGGAPIDWSRHGQIFGYRIGETENHILMMHTVRYLTNQLLYQRADHAKDHDSRDHDKNHDNRRNGFNGAPTCMNLLLYLLRNILTDDFSEYNAKSYQQETRHALLNLCSYAYDHEVRLAAQMALDYVSAHIAVSSNDLRRMVPFRRRNEGKNVKRTWADPDFMNVGLVEWQQGADPLLRNFAIQAGNTRVFEFKQFSYYIGDDGNPHTDRPWDWAIADGGGDMLLDALGDYRLPECIHDLFVTDLHRRFFQRLHRYSLYEEDVTGRNCNNMEIYAGSPSYLITAGGEPATWAIDPTFLGIAIGDQDQQLGVAMPTSFMPTGFHAGPHRKETDPADTNLLCEGSNSLNTAAELIQFGSFSDEPGKVANYGVAPDFACGHKLHWPEWTNFAVTVWRGKFLFINKGSAGNGPGFYLAFLRDEDLTLMEAFDTWLYPNVSFDQFINSVWEKNKPLMDRGIHSNVEDVYITHNGNQLRFLIWNNGERADIESGAMILNIEYGATDPFGASGDAGNITNKFLNGTVMNSPNEGVVEITNYFLETKLTLDMNDQAHPKRILETGIIGTPGYKIEVEASGSNNEVYVDFEWRGETEGDFFHPFNTIAAAAAAVADGGVIKIIPGYTNERIFLPGNKRIKLVATIGEVKLGVR
ncbi:MAG: hypothetical protein IT249_08645 [Chitinophagaceae bacterium]|nr:hypothetical protein [Chitinophagaceae bacterium]